MLGFAALILAAASPADSPALSSAASWWERVTYTISGDGRQQSCRFESSLTGTENCDDEANSRPAMRQASGSTAAFTKITIERRFNPGAEPERVSLHSGDTFLGGQVMALSIDGAGMVRSCNIVGALGEVRPDYGCAEVRAERFEASAGRESASLRPGFMTILVYGHEEQLT